MGAERPRGQARRGLLVVVVCAAVVLGAGVVATWTGLPLPGVLRRYPTAELDRVANRVNADYRSVVAQMYPSGTMCDGSPVEDVEPVARVDRLRSRVIVELDVDDPDSGVRVDGEDRDLVVDGELFAAVGIAHCSY